MLGWVSGLHRRLHLLPNRDGQWFFIPTRADDLVMGNLTRFDLDPVTPNNPFFIKIANAIWGISNTGMLKILVKRYGENLPGITGGWWRVC